MVLYPDVQKKAREEIDRVVGPNRLPTFSDRKNLPYIEALIKEVHRWNPVAPLGTQFLFMRFAGFMNLSSSCPTSLDERRHL